MNQTQPSRAEPDDPVQKNGDLVQTAAPRKLVPWPLLLSGVVLPLICFLFSFPDSPAWQSGSLDDYAQLLLSHRSTAPLYPFLLYNMASMVLLFWQPDRFADRFWVRWGIFSGVLVAAEYWLLFQLAFPEPGVPAQVIFSGLGVLVPWCLWQAWGTICERGKLRVSVNWLIFLCALAGLFLFPWIIAISLWCSTAWAFASYLTVAINLVRRRASSPFRFNLAELFGVVGLLSAHLAAWRFSFLLMLDKYAQLPTTPPSGCFVCTAAAKGHAGVVGTEIYLAAGGATFQVNEQLRHLKALELLLASLSPQLHWQCRRVYDGVGPRAALLLSGPLLADAGYFLLKPLEWFAWLCLIVATHGHMDSVHSLYRSTNRRASKQAGKAPL